jgi:hypothetical protein
VLEYGGKRSQLILIINLVVISWLFIGLFICCIMYGFHHSPDKVGKLIFAWPWIIGHMIYRMVKHEFTVIPFCGTCGYEKSNHFEGKYCDEAKDSKRTWLSSEEY